MSSKFNDVLELIESFSLEEQEQLIEIEKKRITEKKRILLLKEIDLSKKEIAEGKFIEGSAAEIIKAIDDEVKNLK